jgi:hypothetical protein
VRTPKDVVAAMEARDVLHFDEADPTENGSIERQRLNREPQETSSKEWTRVSFVEAMYQLFYIPLVRFKPTARLFVWNLVAANITGLLFLPRLEPMVLWIAIVTGLVFMARVYQKMGFVRLLGAGHGLWLFVMPWLAIRWMSLPPDASGWFEAWLGWVIVTDTISLVLDTRDAAAFLAGDRAPYY